MDDGRQDHIAPCLPDVLEHVLMPNVLEHRQLPQQILFQVSPLSCLLLDRHHISEVLSDVHRRERPLANSRADSNLGGEE